MDKLKYGVNFFARKRFVSCKGLPILLSNHTRMNKKSDYVVVLKDSDTITNIIVTSKYNPPFIITRLTKNIKSL